MTRRFHLLARHGQQQSAGVVARGTGLSVAAVQVTLLSMELRRTVLQLPGKGMRAGDGRTAESKTIQHAGVASYSLAGPADWRWQPCRTQAGQAPLS